MPGGIALSASRFPFFFLSSLFPSYNNSLSLSLYLSWNRQSIELERIDVRHALPFLSSFPGSAIAPPRKQYQLEAILDGVSCEPVMNALVRFINL